MTSVTGGVAMLEAVILGNGSNPYRQIVQILLAAGADLAIADKEGVTARQHARRSGQTPPQVTVSWVNIPEA